MELKESKNNYSKLKIVVSISLVAAFSIMAAALYCYSYINSPPGSLSNPAMIEVRQGDSFYGVAKILKEKRSLLT